MSVRLTLEGDMVDRIAHDHYGRQDMLERVLGANPGLAAMGPVLPAGIEIVLPEAPPRPAPAPIRLWGAS